MSLFYKTTKYINKTKLKLAYFLFTFFFLFSSNVAPVLAAMTYSYDENGNMNSDGTKCFEYNQANQLKKVKNCSNNQTIAEYVYDYQGNRLVKKEYENGNLKKTIYSPTDEYETVKLASNSATENTTYYKVNDETLAKKNPDGTKNYYHNDHLGSTTILTDQNGTKVEETKYDPWGEVKAGGTKSKYLYTGQEKDLETGLNYYGARYYDSHIRRFTQPDDVIQNIYDPQSLNRYSYVRNNPLKYTDPTGNVFQIPVALYLYAAPLAASPDLQTDVQFLAMAISDFREKPNVENGINTAFAFASVSVPGGTVPKPVREEAAKQIVKQSDTFAKSSFAQKTIQTGKQVTSETKQLINNSVRINSERIAFGPAPKYYEKLSPVGKIISPIHLEISKTKAFIEFHWLKTVNKEGKKVPQVLRLWGSYR